MNIDVLTCIPHAKKPAILNPDLEIGEMKLKYSAFTTNCSLTILTLAICLLMTGTALGQETAASTLNGTATNLSKATLDFGTQTNSAKTEPTSSSFSKRLESTSAVRPTRTAGVPEGWTFEIRPYIWLSGLYGTVRVGNRTAEISNDSSAVLGMLDFAAAAQFEAIKGPWRIMLDENYANLGTDANGPRGNLSVRVEPTLNIFEFGASYTAVSIPNKKATATDPLPPVFTAEVLGGGRYFHFGLGIEPTNLAPVEGSRNLVGPFIGNRFKVSPNSKLTLIGKYTVGGSGAGSRFAWSADALADYRCKKSFSIGGGYRWLGLNADDQNNRVGFDGTLRGLMLSMTLYR